jgi:hypothetical protein
MINGGQNIVGHAPGWRRWYTCLIMAGLAAVFAWLFPRLEHGFFIVAGWSSIALPSVTVVMCVDQFVLPRLLGFTRSVSPIPAWRQAGIANWPGIVAVVIALLFGAWGLGLLPGQEIVPDLGLVPVEAWLLAGVIYAGLAAVAIRMPSATTILGVRRGGEREAAAEHEGELTR